jgi:hypothetical protein
VKFTLTGDDGKNYGTIDLPWFQSTTPDPDPDPDPDPQPTGKWLTGIFANPNHAFDGWSSKGVKPDLVDVHCDPEDIGGDWWLQGFTGTKVRAMCLSTHLEVSRATTDQYRRAAITMMDSGFIGTNCFLRTGNEANLKNTSRITNSNYKQWVTKFREVTGAFRAGNPGSQIVLCLNEGEPQSGISWENLIAVADQLLRDGDADIMAIDFYDQWEPMYSESAFKTRTADSRRGSIGWWYQFARARGRKFALPEWGISSGTQWKNHCGGDNPVFIEQLLKWIAARADGLAYESYFEEDASYVASSLIRQNPKSSAKYFQMMKELRA